MKDSDVTGRPVSNDSATHPVAKAGTGAVVGGVAGGVAGGAAAGAVAGGITGPVGAVIGAAAGAVLGALAGSKIDPDVEDTYWRENYSTRPYATNAASYDEYAPAYRYGVDSYSRHPGRSFDDVETDLGRDWNSRRGSSKLEWEHAKHATRDAWHRLSDTVERATPGDSDRDGK